MTIKINVTQFELVILLSNCTFRQ